MNKISSISSVEYIRSKGQNQQPAFTSQLQRQQIEGIPNVVPSYNIKTPIDYQKIEEINLPYDFKGHLYKLANGQRVIIVPKEGETVVKTYVNTGAMNEPDNVRGISHYIEHNLFNGSEGLEAGEFFGSVNNMGAETNASTSFAVTDYYISSNLLKEENLEKKIQLHASMITSPKFAFDMLEKEKGIVNSEINMYQGYADTIAYNATIKNLFNIKSTSQDLIAGSTDNITNLTREDVLDYYNNNYYPANMVTVITGEVEPENVMKLISKYFSNSNKVTHPRKFEELKPLEKTIRQDITSDQTTSTRITMGFVGPKNNDTQNGIIYNALNELLTMPTTGRISQGLKEFNTQAIITAEKIGSRPNDPTAIVIEAETNEKDSQKVLQTIFNQIHSIITNPPTDDEMQTIKKSLLNSRAERFESSYGMNSAIGKSLLDGSLDSITDYEKIVNLLTKEDLVNAAKEFLDLNKAAITVMHPLENSSQRVSFSGNMHKQAINPNNINRYVMPNNFDVVTNDTKTDLCFCELSFDTMNRFKTNPATVELLQVMLGEGTLNKTDLELEKDLQKNGIVIDMIASQNSVTMFGKFAANDSKKAFGTISEILNNPNFTKENFEFAKKKIIDRIERQEKSPLDKLHKELFDGLQIGATKEDILNGLKTVTLDDVKNLYEHIINTAQGHLTVSGPFEKNIEFKNTVFEEIGKYPPVEKSQPYLLDTYKPVSQTKVLTDIDAKEQAQIVEAFTFKSSGNIKDLVSIKLLNNILGGNSSSRLFNDLREKQQLAYAVRSYVHFVDNTGIIKLNIGTTTENQSSAKTSYENIQKSIDGFNKHIERIKTEKVTEEELENAKLYYKNTLLTMNETSSDKNSSLASGVQGFYGPLEDNEILKVIDEITVDDIYNAANYIFAQKPTYSVLATENTINANKDYFDKLIVVS